MPPTLNPLPTLPLHLSLSLTAWIGSTLASACWRSAWPGAQNPPSDPGQSRGEKARQKPPQNPWQNPLAALPQAVSEAGHDAFVRLLRGVSRYQAAEFPRELPEPPVAWRQGAARLLDYSGNSVASSRPPLLLIPSLINRHYILDLMEGKSLARFLAGRSFHVYVLDWGTPGADERDYDCADYVTGPLRAALSHIHAQTGEKITLAGYCMGGVLALALAQLEPEKMAGLALLAAPWDFQSRDSHVIPLDASARAALERFIEAGAWFPPEPLLAMFYLQDPFRFQRKFVRFGELEPLSEEARQFVALERWVNDGVPLSRRVARECLIGWGQDNLLARGLWRVAGETVDPAKINIPVFAAVPRRDRIVPPECARALVDALPGAPAFCAPDSGHVGMVVGRRAQSDLWEKLALWAEKL